MQQTKFKCPIEFTFRKERKRSTEKEKEEVRRGDCCVTDADGTYSNATVHSLLGRLCSLNGHAASVG